MPNLYLKKANENLPDCITDTIIPDTSPRILEKGDRIILDLKNHYVGYFSFTMNYVDEYIDAPVRMYIKFCETKQELSDDFSKYREGLCASWLQEEIVNIDFPGVYKMPRRYAARFIQITILNTPKKLMLSDFEFSSVTSADNNTLKNPVIHDPELEKIDKVAVNTLKNCMQKVFEDGPKRDRRLWIGDLRLEALTNYYTYNNLALVRRCLYLFAAAERNKSGFVPSFIYENPIFVSGNCFLEDYALLYVVSICDYYQHTKDNDTFTDLYDVMKAQLDAAHARIDNEGIITVDENSDVFIDWCEGLKKTTSMHGVYLYTLCQFVDILIKRKHKDVGIYQERLQKAQESAKHILYDKNKNKVINAKDNNQYSVHSTVWMILGGVISGKEAEEALQNALESKESIKPFTPYMHHYVIEAMYKLNMKADAVQYIKKLWGGMLALGADTFFEVYVPGNPEFSPYGDRMVNSMCHAWSCTPAYFIRKYLI